MAKQDAICLVHSSITVIVTALEFIIEGCQSHLNMYGMARTTNYTTVTLSLWLFSILCSEMG